MRLKLLLAAILMLAGMIACQSYTYTPLPGEVEATEFQGTKLTPINEQNNNAIRGTQVLERDTYRLTVDGLVDKPLNLTYSDLLAYPQESRLVGLNCVEGWSFVAKWTGPRLAAILQDARVKLEAKTVIFHSADVATGFTSLEKDYIVEKGIIIALKLNDITLPPNRGFPFQVVAEGKFGYKWAKWVTGIELSDKDFRGYWETAGYNNNADLSGPSFEP